MPDIQPGGIQGVHDAGYAADDQRLRMGILPAEDGHHLRAQFGNLQGIQIMGGDDQIGFRRQLVGWVAPVGVGKGSEPAGFDEFCQPLLNGLVVRL